MCKHRCLLLIILSIFIALCLSVKLPAQEEPDLDLPEDKAAYDLSEEEQCEEISPHKFGVNETPQIDQGFFPGVSNDDLELTEEQIVELKKIKSDAQEKKTAALKELEIPENELNILLKEQLPNLKKVDAKISKIGRLQSEIHRIDMHEVIESRRLLTPSQWRKVQKAEEDQLSE